MTLELYTLLELINAVRIFEVELNVLDGPEPKKQWEKFIPLK